MRFLARRRAVHTKPKVAAMFDEEYAVISAPEDQVRKEPPVTAPRPPRRSRPVPAEAGNTDRPDPSDTPQPAASPSPPRSSYRPWKQSEAKEIKAYYAVTLEAGFIMALALLLSLTYVDYQPSGSFDVALSEQEVVTMQEVVQTQQEQRPPPPPRPAPPIVVPDSRIVEDEPLNFDATLDLNESLDVPTAAPAPPPPDPDPPAEDAEPEIFVAVEEMPVLIGGMKAIQENLRYPYAAAKAGIQGRVIMRFIVDETGTVTQPEVVQGQHKLLDDEALRVVQTLRFTPGRQRGRAVKVQMALPIHFVLKKNR